jgi:hypothetical protein
MALSLHPQMTQKYADENDGDDRVETADEGCSVSCVARVIQPACRSEGPTGDFAPPPCGIAPRTG